MNAGDVLRALDRRWPDSEYLKVREAPQDAARMGRKIDLLTISMWRSRGFELDAVEIKVSMSDWKRELENAAKADWWWTHTHRFWVAVPVSLAEKVKAELPGTWGLLACSDESAAVVVKAPRHDPEPLPWATCIGVMRASADAGLEALQRAEGRGYDRGERAGKLLAERQSGDAHVRAQLDELRAKVKAFEDAAGVSLGHSTWEAGNVGSAVAVVRNFGVNGPQGSATRLRQLGGQLGTTGAQLAQMADDLLFAVTGELTNGEAG